MLTFLAFFTPRVRLLLLGLFALLLFVFKLLPQRAIAPSHFREQATASSQNAFDYTNQSFAVLIKATQQKMLARNYLRHYFSVWTNTNHIKSNEAIKQIELNLIQKFSKNPGWDDAGYPRTLQWIQRILGTMDMDHFPNRSIKAITVMATPLRVLPTIQPSFGPPDTAGEGYPFDNLQVSWVGANTPTLILHANLEGTWSLVLLSEGVGWVPSEALAQVDAAFIKTWQKKPFLTLINNKVPILSQDKNNVIVTELGSLFPYTRKNASTFSILMAVSDTRRHAVIKSATLKKLDAIPFPLRLTRNHMAILMNKLIGIPYGWGGLNGDYDCSLTLLTLFRPFGIWLPRNSAEQAKAGQFTDLSRFNSKQKLRTLQQHALPLLSLIDLPGHIMLYLGEKDQQTYVFHEVWGFHTETRAGVEGRAVIGSSVIMPITLPDHYSNIPKSLLDKVTGFTRVDLQSGAQIFCFQRM